MGFDIGVCGAFGIDMDDVPGCADVMLEFREWLGVQIAARGDVEETADIVYAASEWAERLSEICRTRAGIYVLASARLIWTGSEDERVGRAETEAERVILGFGIYTDPWDWEVRHGVSAWPQSFKDKALMWTWHWGG